MKLKIFHCIVISLLICVVNSAAQNLGVLATWDDFQKRHILNPDIANETDYKSWGRLDWNLFLKNRIGDQFGSKLLNSFIVGNNLAILADLQDGYYQSAKHTGIANNLHWSSSKFEMYILQLTVPVTPNSSYDVYHCSSQFVLAAFDSRNEQNVTPIHYQAQSTSRRTRGKIPLDFVGCEPLKEEPIDHSLAYIASTNLMSMILPFLAYAANNYYYN